jgi:hypothetical protein
LNEGAQNHVSVAGIRTLADFGKAGLTSSRDALNQPVVAANFVPKAEFEFA